MNRKILVAVRGGGDLATGIIVRLFKAGFATMILECEKPSAIRRQVSLCEAVYEGERIVEGVKAVRIDRTSLDEKTIDEKAIDEKIIDREKIFEICLSGSIPLFIDPKGSLIGRIKPDIVVDAIIAKRNLGTTLDMADLVIGVGPGFTAGLDVNYVVETVRGHDLARVIEKGSAIPDTKTPGNIGGYTKERVIHASKSGFIKNIRGIGDIVKKDEELARIYDNPEFEGDYQAVNATIPGIVRGLIREGYEVSEGFKIADIDPREAELKNCFTISDKARSIGGSVLELVSQYANSI